jgi:hypothetical protein
MRGTLHLGIQKTLDVVQSHYQVNLMALSTGYIVANDLDDDGAESEANHLDTPSAPTADILANDFVEIPFSDAPHARPLEP